MAATGGRSQAITDVGGQIRELKGAKKSKEEVQPHLDRLLALKAKFKDVTGEDYQSPNQGSSKQDKKKKKDNGGQGEGMQAAAPAAGTAGTAPGGGGASKNELKKLAKAKAKADKKAAYKEGSAAPPAPLGAAAAPRAPLTGPPKGPGGLSALPAMSGMHRSVTGTTDNMATFYLYFNPKAPPLVTGPPFPVTLCL